jgi:hypothetical protein
MDRRRRRFTMATSSGSARRAIGGPHICHPEPFDLDAVSHRAGLAPASEDTDPGRGEDRPADANASLRADPELIPEAAV